MADTPKRAENGDILANFTVEAGGSDQIPAITNVLNGLLSSVAEPRKGLFDIGGALARAKAQGHAGDVLKHLDWAHLVLEKQAGILATIRQAKLDEVEGGNELLRKAIYREHLKHKLMTTGGLTPDKVQYAVNQQQLELESRVQLGKQYVRETVRFGEALHELLIEVEVRLRTRGVTDDQAIKEAKEQAEADLRRAWDYRNGGTK